MTREKKEKRKALAVVFHGVMGLKSQKNVLFSTFVVFRDPSSFGGR